MEIIFLLVSFLASVIGSICGVGGGVVIKPVLDTFGVYSAGMINFVSSCVVLGMSAYSVIRAQIARDSLIRNGIAPFLGIGAALGGILGKIVFEWVCLRLGVSDTIGIIQGALMFLVTLVTLIYYIRRAYINTYHIKNRAACFFIGLFLGVICVFLGIGGGPINLVALSLFFSMDSKEAAQNSLLMILLSQITSLGFTLLFAEIPNFPLPLLFAMIACGVLGGIAGCSINKRIDEKTVRKLFIVFICFILLICCYNVASRCLQMKTAIMQ